MNSEKILKVVFFILVVVLITEIGYLFYSSNKKNQLNTIIPSTTPPPLVDVNEQQTKRDGIQALNDQTVENIKNLNKGVTKSSILENQFEGIIIEKTNTQQEINNNFSYLLKLKIKGINDETNSFYFNKDELSKIRVKNKNGQNLSISDLKNGDKVSIIQKMDLLKDLNNNLISFEIIKF